MTSGVLPVRQLTIRCPYCGTRPAIEITDADRALWLRLDPNWTVLFYTCHKRICRGRFAVKAAAFRDACQP